MATITANTGRQNVAMLGIGAYRPSRVVTNDEICQTLDSTDEWIYERTGIRSRRWISGDESARSMAVAAAERAISNSGVPREKIGAVLLSTLSWKTKIPHGAPQIAYDLGINGVAAVDLASGCSGFGYGLGLAADMVRSGSTEYVLLICVETLSIVLDPTDRNTAFIFGDGAGAVVVGPSEENGISPTVWGSDGENGEAIGQSYDIIEYMDRAQEMQSLDPADAPLDRMVVTMQGSKVFRWAAIALPKALSSTLEESGITADDIDVFIPHQANARINELMKKNLGLRDEIPMANDIEQTGNTSAASIPLAMEEMLATGKAQGGQTALLLGFGSGLSYAGQVVTLPPAPVETSL